MPTETRTWSLRVLDLVPEGRHQRRLTLALDGQAYPFAAGQAAMLAVAGDTFRKPYSLANAPEDVAATGALEFLVGDDRTPGAAATLAGLRPGMSLLVGPAFGHLVLPDDAPGRGRYVFVAGGTGIAPLRSLLRHVWASRPDVACALAYSARTRVEMAFRPEWLARAARPDFQYVETLTRDLRAPGWTGGVGRLEESDLAPIVHGAVLAFVCGPPAFVADLVALLSHLGLPASHVRREGW